MTSVMRRATWMWNHSLGWVVTWLLIGLIQLYRHTFSLVLPPTCRFHPSCSAYALSSVQTHGGVKGAVLAGWRLLRCNPFNGGGYDPVPTPGHWVPDVYPDGRPRSMTINSRKASHVHP